MSCCTVTLNGKAYGRLSSKKDIRYPTGFSRGHRQLDAIYSVKFRIQIHVNVQLSLFAHYLPNYF